MAPSTNTLLIYDDRRLIAELNGAVSLDPLPLLRGYTWGIDLAGSAPDGEQDAGGIGALLMFSEYSPSTIYHFYHYDGNGNVTGLVKSDGNVSARYEYGPFHDLVARSGTVSEINPFLSSTKFRVRDLDAVYYGGRWLSLPLARWMRRDPTEEGGGINLYSFVENSPNDFYDPDGAVRKGGKWLVMIDLMVQLSRTVEGQAPTRSGSPSYQASELRKKVGAATEQVEKLIARAAGGGPDDPKKKFYRHQGGWGTRGLVGLALLGAGGTVAYAAGGGAERDAANFERNSRDWVRHQLSGDQGEADMDAAMMYLDVLNLTGSSYAAGVLWGLLPQ